MYMVSIDPYKFFIILFGSDIQDGHHHHSKLYGNMNQVLCSEL